MQTYGVGNNAAATQPSTERGTRALQSEDFFKLLVAELEQQDPLEPNDTSDMVAQVSQIRSIELSQQLTDALSTMSNQQQLAGVSDMLGKYVSASLQDQEGMEYEVAGVVTGVRFDSGGAAALELDTGEVIPASAVTHIAAVNAAEQSLPASDKSDEKSEQAAKSIAGESAPAPWWTLNGLLGL